ncbi:MAG: NAD+ synthase [Desulfurococcaceae archaeon]
MKITLSKLVNIPYEEVFKSIEMYVKSKLDESGLDTVVIGLSGGLDSSVLLGVLARFIPRDKIVALIMPDSRVTPVEDVDDAIGLARAYGIKYYVFNIDKIIDSYSVASFFELEDNLATGNLRARVRMTLLYYYANKCRALVAGSSDRSEILIGYFTKHGDGSADLYPIACLYKTQVRELGRKLGLPSKIIMKPSAPRLWRNHIAEKELGIKYDEIDLALYALFDLNLSLEDAVEVTGLSINSIERVLNMHRKSRHKRIGISTPSLPWIDKPIREL